MRSIWSLSVRLWLRCGLSMLMCSLPPGLDSPLFFRGLPTSEPNLVGGGNAPYLLVGCPRAQPKSSGRQHAIVNKKTVL